MLTPIVRRFCIVGALVFAATLIAFAAAEAQQRPPLLRAPPKAAAPPAQQPQAGVMTIKVFGPGKFQAAGRKGAKPPPPKPPGVPPQNAALLTQAKNQVFGGKPAVVHAKLTPAQPVSGNTSLAFWAASYFSAAGGDNALIILDEGSTLAVRLDSAAGKTYLIHARVLHGMYAPMTPPGCTYTVTGPDSQQVQIPCQDSVDTQELIFAFNSGGQSGLFQFAIRNTMLWHFYSVQIDSVE